MSTTKNTTKMLGLLDRIVMPTIFPRENDFKSLLIIKSIKKKVELKQEEITKFKIETLPGGNIAWNEEGTAANFQIDFSDVEENEIKHNLQKMDSEKRLTEDHATLYELFNK